MMPANATNKSNLSSVKSAIDTLDSNTSSATVEARFELKALCKTLRRDIARFEDGIKGLT